MEKKIKPQLYLPFLRFKGFEGEWRLSKLNSLINDNLLNFQFNSSNFLDATSIMSKVYRTHINEPYKLAPKNSIVFIKDGSNAGNFFMNFEGSKIASTCEWFSTCEHTLYIYHFLISKIKFITNNLITGETIPHLYKKTLLNLNVFIPSLPEQQKIAKFFSLLDKQISLWERKLELYLLFYRFYLNKLIPNKRNVNLKLNSIKLNEIIEETNEKVFGNSIKQASVGSLGFKFRDEIFNKIRDFKSNYMVKKVYPNDFVLGMGSKSIDFKINNLNEIVGVSTAYTVYKCKEKFNSNYLNLFIERNIDYFTKHFMIISARQGKSVDKVGFLNEKILIPNNCNQIVVILQKVQETIKYITNVKNNLISKKEYFLRNIFI